MTKMKHHKGYGFAAMKTPFTTAKQFIAAKTPFRSSEPEILKTKASIPPLRSHLHRDEVGFPSHYGNSKKTLALLATDGPTSRGINRE